MHPAYCYPDIVLWADGQWKTFHPNSARKLAAWLLRAADWLEAQDGK